MSIRAIIKLAREIAIGVVVVIATCSFLSWVVGNSMGLGFFVSVGIVLLFPIVVVLLAFTGRFAALRGLLGAIAILFVVQYAAMRVDAARAEAKISMIAPEGPRATAAVDLADFLSGCDGMSCAEVLAKTGADVILRDHAYRLVRGDACRTGALRPMYFEFLKAGYAGLCAEEMPASQLRPSLAAKEIRCDVWRGGDALCDELPRSFTGHIIIVRRDDATGSQVLDRWVIGQISPVSSWFGFVGLSEMKVGGDYSNGSIFSRVFGMPLRGAGITGDGDLEEVLSEMESFLNDPKTARSAAYYLHHLSAARGRENLALLRSHILSLLQSNDGMRIRAGLELITAESRVDVRDLRPQIEHFSQSLDPEIRGAARRALMSIPTAGKKP